MNKLISFIKKVIKRAFNNTTYLPSGMLPPR